MAPAVKDTEMRLDEDLVFNLCKPELRGNALAELAKVPLVPFLISRLHPRHNRFSPFFFPVSREDSCLEFLLVKVCSCGAMWFLFLGFGWFSFNDGLGVVI